ncbi:MULTISPECIES: IS21 family transposase [unclassified Bradyrhizobium]|uniref:IS21 family transposase n=1 Tax=unclassified Bradyrhizobium TaxID=2631580 RepID=UPI001CD56DE5|nr:MULTISPECIES: IS21 family transposase [unclassified Bradyrhizobium]MCA1386367.1 IS21 family transposase [Bradyrhizobium sp. BRP05]MCA1394470.1 IS21 family transposase [Bradyrhizobium sp. IC3123]MCA1423963.1 IS21 family transposase [Bradyrhizobium sp. BRP23]MCA1431294.1 IS21 family transposase [Bradyrhizobium sp. NBAIM16]MCA1480541.1 IS21 family transposase [Bradyrhizobium sp. NBAIM08]
MIQLGDLIVILDLHRQGLSISAIARRTGRDPKTIRKYIARGLEPPAYGPRPAGRPSKLAPYLDYLRERIAAFPDLSAVRLTRELRERGYTGAYTAVKRFAAAIRPDNAPKPFEVRFETPAGQQAQVDFARFVTIFTDEPDVTRIIWLFSMVLGHSRFIFARFVMHQDLQTLLRCHMQAFAVIGGVPIEILYDRMKTAVTGEDGDGHIVYNRSLLALAQHYGFHPRACRPYRAKTKGKVERPFSYIRQDFFLARSFCNLDDLNTQLDDWLANVANVRVHGTTQKVVAEAFAAERPELQALPAGPFDALLKLERRVSHDGLVSIGGNYYSVPDRTRRIVEVQQLPDVIRILDQGEIVAVHPVLEGRRRTRVAPEHRQAVNRSRSRPGVSEALVGRAGDHIPRRSLEFYQAVGKRLAQSGGRP